MTVSGASALPQLMRVGEIELDPATRTLDAEVQLPNRNGELRAGMYGRAAIVTGTIPDAVVVPASISEFQVTTSIWLRE